MLAVVVSHSGCFEKKKVIINAYTSTYTNKKQFGTARQSCITQTSVCFHSSQPVNYLYKDINNCITAGIVKHKVYPFCINRM
jgi:hypothetical protein